MTNQPQDNYIPSDLEQCLVALLEVLRAGSHSSYEESIKNVDAQLFHDLAEALDLSWRVGAPATPARVLPNKPPRHRPDPAIKQRALELALTLKPGTAAMLTAWAQELEAFLSVEAG